MSNDGFTWVAGKDLAIGDEVAAYRGSCNAASTTHRIVPPERVVDFTNVRSKSAVLESGVSYFVDIWDRYWLVRRR